MGEYNFTNGSGQTFKLTIEAQRADTDPHGLAIAIRPDTSDVAEFCKILVSQKGSDPDNVGLQSIRQALKEAILAEQDGPNVPGDIIKQSPAGAELAADNLVSNSFLRACTATSELIQPGINIGFFADGIDAGGASQSRLELMNANGALLEKTTVGRDGTSDTNLFDPNNTHPYDNLEVDEDATGKITAATPKIDGQSTTDFSAVGQVLGSALGRALAPNNQFAQLAIGTVAGAAGQRLAQAFAASLSTDGAGVKLDNVFAGFNLSIAGAGASSVASFLIAELGTALHLVGKSKEERTTTDILRCRLHRHGPLEPCSLLNPGSHRCNRDDRMRNSAVLSVHPAIDGKINVGKRNCRLLAAKNSAKQLVELRMPVALRSVGDGKQGVWGFCVNQEVRMRQRCSLERRRAFGAQRADRRWVTKRSCRKVKGFDKEDESAGVLDRSRMRLGCFYLLSLS
jgi:hypothetical protein